MRINLAPLFALVMALPISGTAQTQETTPVSLRPYSPMLEMASDGRFTFTPTEAAARMVGVYRPTSCKNATTVSGNGFGVSRIVVSMSRQRGSLYVVDFDVHGDARSRNFLEELRSQTAVKGYKRVVKDDPDIFWPDVLTASWLQEQYRTVNGARLKFKRESELQWPANGLADELGPNVDLFFRYIVAELHDEWSSICLKRDEEPNVIRSATRAESG